MHLCSPFVQSNRRMGSLGRLQPTLDETKHYRSEEVSTRRKIARVEGERCERTGSGLEWKQRPRRAGEAKEKDGKKEGSRGISGALGEEAAAVGRQGPATHKPVCGSFVDSRAGRQHAHTHTHPYIYMDV